MRKAWRPKVSPCGPAQVRISSSPMAPKFDRMDTRQLTNGIASVIWMKMLSRSKGNMALLKRAASLRTPTWSQLIEKAGKRLCALQVRLIMLVGS
jgi:hypothetical protein